MISSYLNRCGFCYASLLAILSAVNKKTSQLRLPKSEFQVSEHIRTGYIWQWNEWQLEKFCRLWTYWVLFDKSNSEIDSDRQWLDFVHYTKVVKE